VAEKAAQRRAEFIKRAAEEKAARQQIERPIEPTNKSIIPAEWSRIYWAFADNKERLTVEALVGITGLSEAVVRDNLPRMERLIGSNGAFRPLVLNMGRDVYTRQPINMSRLAEFLYCNRSIL
jgi:hypothetical protein